MFATVLAETEDGAEAEVWRVRGEDIDGGEAHEAAQFARTVASWAAETPLQTWQSWNFTAKCYEAAPGHPRRSTPPRASLPAPP
ncbi:MAG: hypothetical protein M1608_06145 [Candidatus Omnitrophica bacterium]|nr:hypothetical protein [Candidatus Omnitrophota bacterium]